MHDEGSQRAPSARHAERAVPQHDVPTVASSSRQLLWWVLAGAAAGAVTRIAHPYTLVLTGPVFGIAQWLVLCRALGQTGWLAAALFTHHALRITFDVLQLWSRRMKRTRWIFGLCLIVLAEACGAVSEPIAGTPAVVQPQTTAAPVARPSPTSAQGEARSPASAAQPTLPSTAGAEDAYGPARETMVQEGVIGWGITDTLVIDAMRTVPRHAFVPPDQLSQAYENHPLPIGYGQTISQPYIVALMTQAVRVSAGDRVLEIGTGSGYQAAVLAELAGQVYTVEIIGPLAEQGRERLARLGYDNVTVRHADGYFGWSEEAPFDAIVVTAAPDHIPLPLVRQLNIGGRMVIPVGPVGGYQTLWLVMRVSEDEVRTEDLGEVRFVPLTRETK